MPRSIREIILTNMENDAGKAEEIEDFKKLIATKFHFNCKIINDNLFLSKEDTLKVLDEKTLPLDCFENMQTLNSKQYCLLTGIMDFLKKSSETNIHYVIDYHQPMKWNEINYSNKTNIILDVIENVLNYYKIRGICGFNLIKHYGFDYRCDYFINLPIPIVFEITDCNHKFVRSAFKHTEELQMLEDLQIKVIQIDAETWKKFKCVYFEQIKSHIDKFYAMSFLADIIEKSDELNDIVEALGKGTVEMCASNSKFPYSVEECLKKFDVNKTTGDHVMSFFKEDQYNDSDTESEVESDIESDIESDEEDDDECPDYDDNNSVYSTESNESDQMQNTFIPDVDYHVNADGKIYVNQPTLIIISVIAGSRKAQNFIRLSHKLTEYISSHGRLAYENLMKEMFVPMSQREKMYATYEKLQLKKN